MRYCPHCKGPIRKGELLDRLNKLRKPKPQRLLTTPTPQGADYTRVWQAMRIMGQFTLAELRATTECGRGAVQGFNRALVKAGYVRCVRERQVGVAGGDSIFRLVRNTGPLPPRLREHSIFDVNTQQEVPHVL